MITVVGEVSRHRLSNPTGPDGPCWVWWLLSLCTRFCRACVLSGASILFPKGSMIPTLKTNRTPEFVLETSRLGSWGL